eukprot:scaffold64665_cov61-Phaeocystis_antarctica.AAC.1
MPHQHRAHGPAAHQVEREGEGAQRDDLAGTFSEHVPGRPVPERLYPRFRRSRRHSESVQSPPMMTLAAANIAIGLWQTYSAYSLLGGEASPTKGFWFGGKMTNTAIVFFSYSGVFMFIAACALSLGVSSSHELAAYSDILKANPELRLLTLNILMNTVFVNNVA